MPDAPVPPQHDGNTDSHAHRPAVARLAAARTPPRHTRPCFDTGLFLYAPCSPHRTRGPEGCLPVQTTSPAPADPLHPCKQAASATGRTRQRTRCPGTPAILADAVAAPLTNNFYACSTANPRAAPQRDPAPLEACLPTGARRRHASYAAEAKAPRRTRDALSDHAIRILSAAASSCSVMKGMPVA